MADAIEAIEMRTSGRPSSVVRRRVANRELYSWYFFRVSGLLLIVLALGHFALMHVFTSILNVDYSFAARRWQAPGWRVYDWTLLALALLHGFNGLRVAVDEHVRPARRRRLALGAVGALTATFLVLGTYVVVAFRAPG